MLIIFRNSIVHDDLNDEDLMDVQNAAISHNDGRCWHEISDGDESLQRALGDAFTWDELLDGDYSSKADVIVAPRALRSDIFPALSALGFQVQDSCYSGEDRYFCEGNELILRRGRKTGYSPINGEGRAMVKRRKAWSMPLEVWDWLESQPNQSEVLRLICCNAASANVDKCPVL